MNPFEWLNPNIIEDFNKRKFHGTLEVIGDEEEKAYTVCLSWISRNNTNGEIIIPVEGIKKIHSKILELEDKGFKEKLGQQVYPP